MNRRLSTDARAWLPRASERLRIAGWLVLLGGAAPVLAWDQAEIDRRAEALYGPQAEGRQRLEAWWRLLDEQRERDVEEQLRAVNGFFNATLRFDEDRNIWQRIDYWATPVESLYQGAADCEDYALAKYVSLRRLGVPMERLRLTYVKADGQAHMVLAYYAEADADPWVLDNRIARVLPASQRSDLQPVYAFNGEGLWYADRPAGDSLGLSRWQDVLQRMRREGFPPGVPR
jgi:predicted transglutaminase-like cysteine proteinase